MKYQDLQELAIIKSIGISHNQEYTLYAEIIEEIDKDNTPKMQVYETKGKDMQELFSNIKLLVNKEIYLSHIDLLLLDENLNNNDYQNLINYFLNNHELRNDFYCVLSNDIKNILEISKYDEIEELIETNKENKRIINITFEEIIKDFLDNKSFNISKVILKENTITFDGNFKYYNNQTERIKINEKDKD